MVVRHRLSVFGGDVRCALTAPLRQRVSPYRIVPYVRRARSAPVATVLHMSRTHDVARPLAQLRQATALVRAALVAAAPGEVAPPAAHEMATALGSLEKLVGAGAARYAQAAGIEATTLLAAVSGTHRSAARRKLEVTAGLACAPVLDAAFSSGDLSFDQAAVLSPLAAEDPPAAEGLVELAKAASVSELKAEVARVLRARRSEAEVVLSERQLHRRRYCRTWVPDGGGLRVDAFFGPSDGAALLGALERETRHLFSRATAAGAPEPLARLRADALVALVNATPSGAGGGRPEVLVRVDAAALVRGEVADGECCEIAGIGPVSVATARELLGKGLFTILVQDGVDITTVTSATRDVPARVERALLLRDTYCVVPGCGTTERLETDHFGLDYSWDGPTALANLCRLCQVHHRMKTRTGWQLSGGPGKWQWLPPKSYDQLAEAHAKPRRRRLGQVPRRGSPPPTTPGPARTRVVKPPSAGT